MYLLADDFIKGVTRSFSFLTDFSFTELGYELTSSRRGYNYFYTSNYLTVRIHYSLTNDWIDVDFIYEPDARNIVRNWDNSISLMTLFAYNNMTGYELLMPKKIGFSQSIESIGQKTKQIAENILRGLSFVTDGEVLKDLRRPIS